MIDHVSIAVSDLAAAAAFYAHVLQPLGFTQLADRERTVGFGRKYPEFWLNARPRMAPVPDNTGNHVCLRALNREAVVLFHERAVSSGGRSDGEPGIRQGQMTEYFGAFIRDPDGNRIEVATFPRNGDGTS